jgi:hypothetical protein
MYCEKTSASSSHAPRRIIIRGSLLLALGALVVVAPIFSAAASAAITNNVGNGNVATPVGTLSTASGSSIPAPDVYAWLQKYVTNSKMLLILSECFGGNALAFMPGAGNIAALSATSVNQLAQYGGFDSHAAAALAPGANTTALDVFNAGNNNKGAGETPQAAAAPFLAPTAFKLISTNDPAKTVQARQIVFYAGSPDGGNNTSDADQLNTITTNFAPEANTAVTGVGGNPAAAPFTGLGTAAGLQGAIQAAGNAITANTGGPLNIPAANQQFILFVGDHGGARNVAAGLNRSAGAMSTPTNAVESPYPPAQILPINNPVAPAVPAGAILGQNPVQLVQNFQTMPVMPVNANTQVTGSQSYMGNVDSIPSFSILLPLHDVDPATNTQIADPVNQASGLNLGTPPTDLVTNPVNPTGDPISYFILCLVNTNPAINADYYFYSSLETTYIPSPDDLNSDEGLRVAFQVTNGLGGAPIPSSNAAFANIFFGQNYDVYLYNFTGADWDVGEFAQDNPSIPPSVPEPATAMLGITSSFLMMMRRRRRDTDAEA